MSYDADREAVREDMAYVRERTRFYRDMRMKAHRAKKALDEAMVQIRMKPENYTTASPDFLGDLVACIEQAHESLEIADSYFRNEVSTTLRPK